MSSTRHRKSKPSTKNAKETKRLYIKLFKLIDPICQSILFFCFIYYLNTDNNSSYGTILKMLIYWQLLSVFINFFLGHLELFKAQRLAFLVLIIPYILFFLYREKQVNDKYILMDAGMNQGIPLYHVLLMTAGIILVFWYNIICYREIRNLLGE